MAAPVLPCDSCGSPISDSALESGEAINLLGKRYCGACKAEAAQSVSLDDLSGKAPAAQAAPARKAAARPAPPAPKAPPPRPAPAAVRTAAAPARRESPSLSRKPPVAPKSSRTPVIVAAVLVVALLAGGYVAFKPPAPPEKPGSGAPTPPKSTPASAPDREAQAKAAYNKVEEISRRAGVSAELLLAAIAQAQPACKGSEWEKRLEDLRAKAQKDKESEDSAKDLAPLIDELKGAVATDTEFKRYSELQPKFQLAIETAGRTQSARLTEIRSLQHDYNSRYEKLAEPYTAEISEAANALAEERRYDDAIRKIETFPPQFRNSGSWTVLQKLKADIERRKKQLPPKK